MVQTYCIVLLPSSNTAETPQVLLLCLQHHGEIIGNITTVEKDSAVVLTISW